mgnify:CR=1 FL=1
MTEPNPIRVIVVDDHKMVRNGLKTFIDAYADLELVGQAADGKQALQLCIKHQPDVVLMDMIMPEMDGIEAMRLIRQRHATTQVIALTSFHEGELVQKALDAGAISYLLKDLSASELAAAIRAAHAGKSILAQEVTSALIQSRQHTSSPGADLTARELEVLTLLAEGLSNPQIAELLIISRPTVSFHVSNILAKLDAANRAEAVALAYKQGLIKA